MSDTKSNPVIADILMNFDKELEFLKSENDILTQYIDGDNFVIGDKTFTVGDLVDLDKEESEILAKIKYINLTIIELRQFLVDRCHPAEKGLDPEIRPAAHAFKMLGAEMKYLLNRLLNRFAARIGGNLPLKLDDDIEKFTIRPLTNESLNYTPSTVLALLNMNEMATVRELSFKFAKERKDSVIDTRLNEAMKFQPIIVHGFLEDGTVRPRTEAAVAAFLEKNPRPHKTLIMMDHINVYMINIQTPNPERWKKIREYADTIKPEVVWVLETQPSPDQKISKVALSAMYLDVEHQVVEVSRVFEVRIDEGAVVWGDEKAEFMSKPEDQYGDLIADGS